MRVLATIALTITGLGPVRLDAQRPIQLLVAGGVSAPQGPLADNAEVGWHVLGAVNVTSLMLPLGLRFEGAYHRFSGSRSGEVTSPDRSVMSITGNASYRWPMTNSIFSPYLIAGLGAYTTKCESGISCGSDTGFGWNAGLGTKLYVLGFRSFLEARAHLTTRDGVGIRYFPVTFGLTF